MSDTVSPEAIVRAALERAQAAIKQENLKGDMSNFAAQWAVDTLEFIAADPAEVAEIIKNAAGEDRG